MLQFVKTMTVVLIDAGLTLSCSSLNYRFILKRFKIILKIILKRFKINLFFKMRAGHYKELMASARSTAKSPLF